MAEETPRLYIGNLPYVAQREDIEKLFNDNNVEIKKIDMSIDLFTGRNPSYCFVDFHDQETAQHVLDTMQGQNVRGRPIRINLKTERRTGAPGNRIPTKTYDRGWKPKEVPSIDANPEDAYAFDRWKRDDAQANWTAPAEEGRRLWVGGLPRIPNQDSLNVEMRRLFQDYNVQAVSKLISPHHTQWNQEGSLYFCYVDVATPHDAKNAVTMLHGLETPYGGTYKIRPAQSQRGTGIVSREQLGSTSKLYIGGLPEMEPEALESEVRQLLGEFNVKYISRLIKPHPSKQTEDKDGNYHYCFAELSSAPEAQSAVEKLDGKETPSGAVYKIRLARDNPKKPDASAGEPQQQTRRQNEPRSQPATPRNLGGSWRRSD